MQEFCHHPYVRNPKPQLLPDIGGFWGLGLRAWGLEFKGLGLSAWGLELRIQGFRVYIGFRGLRFAV